MIQIVTNKARPSPQRNELLRQHYPLVMRVVGQLRGRLPATADFEELHSIGVTGLVCAVDHYDSSRAGSFEAYACLRIRGTIMDALRRMDTLPRNRRTQLRALQATVGQLEQSLGRVPTDAEVAHELGLSLEAFAKLKLRTRPCTLMSLDEPVDSVEHVGSYHDLLPDEAQRPGYEDLEQHELIEDLMEHIKQLPQRLQKVLCLYYVEEFKLSEIAEAFGVTEARVCQLRAQAIQQLKKQMCVTA